MRAAMTASARSEIVVPMAATNSIEICLLGPFEVRVDGEPARATGSKRDGLLASLALRRGRAVSVDTLIEELWGADVPATPRNAIQHHVARLRAALGPAWIIASSNGYALPSASTDAVVFEELVSEARAAARAGAARTAADLAARALALWRGPALQGLPDTVAFGSAAARLEELRVDALEERFEAALAVGEHREIVSELQHAIDETPFRERLWRQLMLALYRSGRQADALETYRLARRVHVEKLGLEPGPELRRIEEAILAQDPSIAHVASVRRAEPATSLDDRPNELADLLVELRENLRHAEELYERVCSAATRIGSRAGEGLGAERLVA
jgi:DNA-binding SARP family transcriptional activator